MGLSCVMPWRFLRSARCSLLEYPVTRVKMSGAGLWLPALGYGHGGSSVPVRADVERLLTAFGWTRERWLVMGGFRLSRAPGFEGSGEWGAEEMSASLVFWSTFHLDTLNLASQVSPLHPHARVAYLLGRRLLSSPATVLSGDIAHLNEVEPGRCWLGLVNDIIVLRCDLVTNELGLMRGSG